MTEDEKLAEEYTNSKGFGSDYNNITSSEANEEIEKAVLYGLTEGRKEKWHDLRKNPNDLPEENQEVLVLFTLPDKSKNDVMLAEFENNDFNFVDLQDVIAWCEIPTFEV